MYYRVNEDGVKANSKEEAVALYNEHHGLNNKNHDENTIDVEEVPSNLEVDLVSGDFPEELTDYEHTTVADVFWYFKPDVVIENMLL